MIFKRRAKRTERNSITADIRNEISQKCLDPERLVGNLTLALSKKINGTSGHVHIHFRNKSDHLVIVWSNGRLREIVAKSPRCEKGQCVKWDRSQFADYEREEVPGQFYNEIERIRTNEGGFSKTWSSWQGFIDWLIQENNYEKKFHSI